MSDQSLLDVLTDDQCDEFRRTPGSFNTMVRTVYRAGQQSAKPGGQVLIDADALSQLWNALSALEAGDIDSAKAAGAKARRLISQQA